jgi:hypothetical protein
LEEKLVLFFEKARNQKISVNHSMFLKEALKLSEDSQFKASSG